MKPIFTALCILTLLVAARPVTAEFYRYVDKHGNVLYTDDLSKIPADQRAKAAAYVESPPVQLAPPAQKPADTEEDNQATGETEAVMQERRELQAQGDALNKEYDQLIEERTQLDQEKGLASSNEQIEEHNRKIVDFNARIQDYEKRRDDYATKVKEFNDRTAAGTTPPDS